MFETEADYKDPAVQALIEAKGWAVWPLIQLFITNSQFRFGSSCAITTFQAKLVGKSDDQGRDVLARILLWLKSIVAFGLALTFCSALFGITVGAIQGYYGGWVDLLGQRLVEVWNEAYPCFYGHDSSQYVCSKCILAIFHYVVFRLDRFSRYC